MTFIGLFAAENVTFEIALGEHTHDFDEIKMLVMKSSWGSTTGEEEHLRPWARDWSRHGLVARLALVALSQCVTSMHSSWPQALHLLLYADYYSSVPNTSRPFSLRLLDPWWCVAEREPDTSFDVFLVYTGFRRILPAVLAELDDALWTALLVCGELSGRVVG